MNELIIQIIAALNKQLSKKQIETDIKNLEKTPFYIKLIGRLNKSLTRGQIQADIRDVQNTANSNPIEINAEINSNGLQQSFNEARENLERNIQNNPIEVDVNANVDTNEILQAQQQIEQHTNRIFGDYINAHEIYQRVIQSIKVALQEIEKLNKAEIDLQMITQKSANEVKSLMQDYNSLAKEMGATTLQVTDGASEWLRQGKSISDTNTLIRDSMILSKISQMESSEATKHLTSAMNGFKLEASEVIGIVDKLNAVDLESASDAAGLAESLSRCANSANIAGISVDKLISYIATVSEVTQKSASSVGEGFKSITARLQNIKVNKFIDEDGINISGEISDAEKILNKFGIALRNNAKEFRNAEDVIDDVAKSWHNMSSVEQSAIASAFGTVHQRENVIALFENYNRVLELTEVSANSAGTAMEKFAVYEGSLESATNRLTASLQGIAYNTIDSNFLKNLANGTAQIVELIDKTQLLKTGLTAGIFTGAITGLVALGTRMVAVRNNVAQFTQAMNISRQSTALNANQITQLTGNVQGLSQVQLRLVVSSRQLTNEQRIQVISATGLSRAEAEAQLQTWGLANAENGAATATFSLRGAWEGLKASIISNPIGLIVAGLTTAVTVISNVKQRQEELRQSISETAQTAKEQTDKLNDLISTYEEFADKVTYTAEEKEKLKSIQEQLVEAYHTEADEIDLVNGKYDEQIEKLRQLKKEKLEDAELSLIAEREQAKQGSKNGTVKDVRFKISSENFKTEDDYNKIAQALKELKTKSSNYAFSDNISLIDEALGFDGELHFFSGNSKQRVKEIKEVMNVLKEYGYTNLTLYSELNDLLVEHQKLVDAENSAVSNLAENKFQQFELSNPFEKVDGKDAYIAWKNSLLETAKEDTDLQNELSNLAEKQFPDYQKYFDNIAELKAKYVDTTTNISNAISKMDFIKSLSDEDLEIATQIPNLFKDGLDGAAKVIENWKNNPANKIEADIDTDNIKDFTEVLETASKEQSALKSAMEDMADTGYISSSTYATLIEMGGNFTDCLEVQNGKLVLNIEKLKELKKAEYELEIQTKNLAIAETEHNIALSAQGRDYDEVKRLTEELTRLRQEKAALITLQDEFDNTKPDEKKDSSSSSKSDKPQSVLDFEQEYKDYQHEIAMGRKEEDAEYYDWLDKRANEVYSGLADYQDDLYKYEEEVYKGRKKLAEEDFNNKHKSFEKYVDYLKEYADELSETSITSDGTKLNTQEKYREIAAVYTDIQSAIQREINRIVQVGVEGNEELLEELEKQLKEYADKVTDTFKSAVETEKSLLENQKSSLSDVYDKEIDKIKKQQEDSKKAADAEIDLIQEKIDNLKKVNDEKQQEYDIEKAKQDLEKAGQRTRMVYGADGRIIYRQDNDAIAEAQQNLDKLLLEKQVNALESQKSLLEDMRDKESESYDKLIEDIESQKEQDERQFDILIQRLEDYLNPNSDTSNSDVWSEIAKMDGASYKKGKWVDKDGTEIDITALLSKADEIVDSNDKSNNNVKTGNDDTTGTDKVNQTLDKANEVIENLKENDTRTVVNPDDFVAKLLYTMGGKTPDAYERYKRGEYGDIFKKLSGVGIGNSYNPAQSIIDNINQNNSKMQSVNVKPSVSVGELSLNIQTPVGTIEDIAKHAATGVLERAEREALMGFSNAFQKQMYTNLK